jgi:uncharacterized protein
MEAIMATTFEGHMHERRHTPERRSEFQRGQETRPNALGWISLVLLIVGGINWGLVGLFQFDLVAALFREMSALSRVVYVLVGVAALYTIYTERKKARST